MGNPDEQRSPWLLKFQPKELNQEMIFPKKYKK
jgi:hypothetical protein